MITLRVARESDAARWRRSLERTFRDTFVRGPDLLVASTRLDDAWRMRDERRMV